MSELARIGEESLLGALALSIAMRVNEIKHLRFESNEAFELHIETQPEDAEIIACNTCKGDGCEWVADGFKDGYYELCPSCKGDGLAHVYREVTR